MTRCSTFLWTVCALFLGSCNPLGSRSTVGGTDGAGNVGPIATFSSGASLYSNISPLPVTVTWNRPVTSFSLADLQVTNGSLQNFGGTGSTFSFEVVAASEGAVTISLTAGAANDLNGNPNETDATFQFFYDQTVPSVVISRHPAQLAFAETLPVIFDIAFSEPMDITFFSTATFTQNGNATGVTWTLNNTGDNQNFTLVASAVSNGCGSFDPSLVAGALNDRAGNGVTASTGSYLVQYIPHYLSTKLWLKADTLGLANGASVTSWADQSAAGNSPAELTTPPSYLTPAVNGQPAVRFDGTSSLTTPANSTIIGNPDLSVVMVGRVTGFGLQTYPTFLQIGLTAADGQSAWYGLEAFGNTPYAGFYNGGTRSGSTFPAGFAIYTWVRNSGSGSNDTQTGNSLYFNGVLLPPNPAINSLSVNLTNGPLLVGKSLNGPIQADIAEIFLFHGVALSTTNRTLIENYLNAKYALY